MTSSLSTRQGLLNKAAGRLSALLDTAEEEIATELPTEQVERKTYLQEKKLRLKKLQKTVQTATTNVDNALRSYTETADMLDNDIPQHAAIMEKVLMISSTTQDLIIRAQSLLSELEIASEDISTWLPAHAVEKGTVSLEPMPIPKFNGKIWEWDQFWNAFDYSVNSRNIDDFHKMKYLIASLEGEPQRILKQFQVSSSNYTSAIDFLKRRYGNPQLLLNELADRLQKCRARSRRIEDQRVLYEDLSTIVNQMIMKGESVDSVLIQKQILSKFNESIQRYVLRKKQKQLDTWSTTNLLSHVCNFIDSELEIQRHVKKEEERREYSQSGNNETLSKTTSKRNNEKKGFRCFFCEETGHSPRDCTYFTTREQRINHMKRNSLCMNCGESSHRASECSKGACRICNKIGHHTSICRQANLLQERRPLSEVERKALPAAEPQKLPPRKVVKQHFISSRNAEDNDDVDNEVEAVMCMKSTDYGANSKNCVLIGEAHVLNPATQELDTVHILLDTGADRSFVSEDLAKRLQLKNVDTIHMSISTFGNQRPREKECGVATLQIFDRQRKPHRFKVARIEHLTESLQQSKLTKEDKQYLSRNNLQLSINHKYTEIRPEILLGCSDTFSLINDQNMETKTLPSGLRLIPSLLGYLVIGKNADPKEEEPVIVLSETKNEEAKWDEFLALQASGVQEFVGTKAQEQDQVNKTIWDRFEASIELHSDGYHVRLPWKENAHLLPDNKSIAFKRLCSGLAKLRTTPDVLQQYHQTFLDQRDRGIIEEVLDQQQASGNIIHYLSHQAIITPMKEFTKLRVVFDASAHFKDKPSLNDVLHQGPVILPVMRDMLIRFRIGDIALIADVEKAFLQVHLHEEDRDATRCLWVRDPLQPPERSNIVTYRFTRVTFGLNCSPFLLAGTIKHHLQRNTQYVALAKELHENVYVDNVILTASHVEEALEKYRKSKAVFNEMNMNLRGYLSNYKEFNEAISPQDRSGQLNTKVLGIEWYSAEDTLAITTRFGTEGTVTKRTTSKQLASMYDPMGWLTPLLIKGKLFLQSLWKAGYDWDTKLSSEHEQEWNSIVKETNGYRRILERRVSKLYSNVKLVLFADASARVMAACAYLVTETASHLIFARSKLANWKEQMTIPKMETYAVTMATRMALTLRNALSQQLTIESITIFTDSEIALSWLSSYPIKENVGRFVKNRIVEIRAIVENMRCRTYFGHVRTNENPADCATRGFSADEAENHIWWTGPSFLMQGQLEWPNLFPLPQDSDYELEEGYNKQNILHTITKNTSAQGNAELLDWSRHNTLESAQTSIAIAMRFISNICSRMGGPFASSIRRKIPDLENCRAAKFITAKEREAALRAIIRNHQGIHVTEQLKRSVKNLNLQPDHHNILRCRGRLDRAQIPELAKNPIFVAAKTPLAVCIICEAHLPFHQGTSHTIATVRNKYWIPKLRQQVQSFIRKCIPCQKMNALPFQYPAMGPLPERRVVKTKPFQNTGIDYFGPLTIKGRDEFNKVYGLIITCMTTRLIHLEVVTDMSTGKLLLALRRFFARRGIPKTITSDNGPSLTLADQILKNVFLSVTNDEAFQNTMARRGVEWTFITPYAPWQGAFYERLIKSVKHSLFKTIGNRILTEEELITLLTEIEGSLNTRPLTYQGSEIEQLAPLRPIDFIVKDINITYPFETLRSNDNDPAFRRTAFRRTASYSYSPRSAESSSIIPQVDGKILDDLEGHIP